MLFRSNISTISRTIFLFLFVLIFVLSLIYILGLNENTECKFNRNSIYEREIKIKLISENNITKSIVESYNNNEDVYLLQTRVDSIEINLKNQLNYEEQLFYYFTDTIFEQLKSQINIDRFFFIVEWSKSFSSLNFKFDSNHVFIESLNNSWNNYIHNSIQKINKDSLSQCQKQKFIYIENYLNTRGYFLTQNQSNVEKVIFNIKNKNWYHLLESVYYQTNILEKVLITAFLLTTLLLYVFAFYFLLLVIKKKVKTPKNYDE